jgi:TPR repeat protein
MPSRAQLLTLSVAVVLGLAPGCNRSKTGLEHRGSTLEQLRADCRKGRSRSCLRIASAHFSGKGAALSYTRAAHWFRQACQLGAPNGCFHLANMTEQGQGVKKDLAAARSHYDKACKGDVGPGCYRLGLFMFLGHGGARDPDQAATIFRKACGLSHKYQGESCFNVVSAFRGPGGMLGSNKQIGLYLRKSCELKYPRGCAALARLYEQGRGGVSKDRVKARALYGKACNAGLRDACEAVRKLDVTHRTGSPRK